MDVDQQDHTQALQLYITTFVILGKVFCWSNPLKRWAIDDTKHFFVSVYKAGT